MNPNDFINLLYFKHEKSVDKQVWNPLMCRVINQVKGHLDISMRRTGGDFTSEIIESSSIDSIKKLNENIL